MFYLKNVSKYIGPIKILDNFNLKINKGEIISFFGPNGCGKTTLLRVLAGLEDYQGEIKFSEKKHKTHLIFQDYRSVLMPWANIEDNLHLILESTGSNNFTLIDIALKTAGLYHKKHCYPYQLSGGQQQKIILISAFLSKPDLLLLDEPFSSLDFKTTRSLELETLKLFENQGTTIIFISHELDEAIFLSDKLIILSETPTKIKNVVNITLPRPRKIIDYLSPEFLRLRGKVLQILEEGIVQDY